jgi:hypothetical protein
VLLWIATTLLTGFLFARRLAIPDRLRRAVIIAWAFLFLILGPVYYHLQVPIILLLWLFDPRRFWRSLFAVVLASAWAGISRVNWFPVPAMLAIALYLLEVPVLRPEEVRAGIRGLVHYLIPPFIWSLIGLGSAFAAQALYAFASKNPGEQFTSSFTSDLLWYRLVPNPTFPLGILRAILLVSLPLFLLIMAAWGVAGAPSPTAARVGSDLVGAARWWVGGKYENRRRQRIYNLDAYVVLVMVISVILKPSNFALTARN